jgi:hypothetical protein
MKKHISKTIIDINTNVAALCKRIHRYFFMHVLHTFFHLQVALRSSFSKWLLWRQWIDEDNDYLKHVVFSDEATFHICGKVNRHNVHIWGQNLSKPMDWERLSKTMATTFARHYQSCFLFMGYTKGNVYSSPVADLATLKARITEAILKNNGCKNNGGDWRDASKYMVLNRVSLRCTQGYKRSACWSLLIMGKKLHDIRYKLQKPICLYLAYVWYNNFL